MRTTVIFFLSLCSIVACSDAASERLVGDWRIRLHLDSVERPWWEMNWRPDTIRLRPPIALGTLHFAIPPDDCFDCVEGDFSLDVTPILDHDPPDNRTRGWFRHDSVKIMLGMRGSDLGELELGGFFIDDSTIAGRWNQIFETYNYQGGAFLITRNAR